MPRVALSESFAHLQTLISSLNLPIPQSLTAPYGSRVYVYAGALLPLLIAIILMSRQNRKRLASGKPPLPPGPPKSFLVGNLFQLPTKDEWITYDKWAKEYKSDVLHLSAAGDNIIILNSHKAANDLLEKKSNIYSDRPPFTMVNEHAGWEWMFAFMRYGSRWRERRRLFQQHLNLNLPHTYQPFEAKHVKEVLPRILDDPEGYIEHIKHMTGAIAISMAYGLPTRHLNDPNVEINEEAMIGLVLAAVPGAYLVDAFPWLRWVPEWMPGAGWKRKARVWKNWTMRMYEEPYAQAEKAALEGKGQPCFVSNSLAAIDPNLPYEPQRQLIKETVGTVFVGGADTTTATLRNFFLAMLLYPETQKKAQRELDRVTGGVRLPTHHDEKSMPYLQALVKEVIRWEPVTPFVIPHSNTEDDIYNGYFIPKGSTIIPNAWAMLYDEEVYPDPWTFKPERFLTPTGQLNPKIRDPIEAAFGFGRRICPGRHMGISVASLTIANILTFFNIEKAVDPTTGEPIVPVREHRNALIRHAADFPAKITPRSRQARELIEGIAIAL